MACKGDGVLTRDDLLAVRPTELEHYVLTVGLWGWKSGDRDWYQTTRSGVNIVLQLNFSRKHDRLYRKLIDPHDRKPYTLLYHPVCKRGRNTLAWARLDMELATGEALIEEVQTDWLREAYWHLRDAEYALRGSNQADAERIEVCGAKVKALDVVRYGRQVLQIHRRYWADAMLSAAIWFLIEEIGIRRIWYHDHATGARLKKVGGGKPPRSLYTDLPRRFCFERTSDAPSFLAACAPKQTKQMIRYGKARFWRLSL